MMRGGGQRVLTTSLTATVRAIQVEGSFRNTGGLLYALSVTILISASIAIALHTPSESPPHRPKPHSLQVQQHLRTGWPQGLADQLAALPDRWLLAGDFRIVLREYLSGANSAVPYFLGRTLAGPLTVGPCPSRHPATTSHCQGPGGCDSCHSSQSVSASRSRFHMTYQPADELPCAPLWWLGVVFSVDLLALALLSYVVSGLSLQPSALAWYCVIISLLIFGAQSVGYISSSFSSNPVVGLALRKCFY